MTSGLFYLGFLLLFGAFFLYVRFNMKKINLTVSGLLDLTTALSGEIEMLQKILGKSNKDEDFNDIQTVSDLRQVISDDDDDDDDEDDEEDEDEDEDGNDDVIELLDISNNNDDDIKIMNVNKETNYEKMTVSNLKELIKENNLDVKTKNLKKSELIEILENI